MKRGKNWHCSGITRGSENRVEKKEKERERSGEGEKRKKGARRKEKKGKTWIWMIIYLACVPVEVINIPLKNVDSIQVALWKFKWIEWILIRGQIAVGKWTAITVHSINLDRPLWWLVKTNVVTGRSLGLNRSNKPARWLGKRLGETNGSAEQPAGDDNRWTLRF